MNRNSCNDPYFPILLPKIRYANQIIVVKTHWVLKHSRIYSVLANLRRQFYIYNCFTVVKKNLQQCIMWSRFNKKTLELNQSPSKYVVILQHPGRNHTDIPFNYSFIDYARPFFVKIRDELIPEFQQIPEFICQLIQILAFLNYLHT